METIQWSDFEKIHLVAGTIINVEDFPEAKKPAYKLTVDLGPLFGIKKSSAQITKKYSKQELIGKQILCVINFPNKQIGPFISEFLTTGFMEEDGVVLAIPDKKVANGTRLA